MIVVTVFTSLCYLFVWLYYYYYYYFEFVIKNAKIKHETIFVLLYNANVHGCILYKK